VESTFFSNGGWKLFFWRDSHVGFDGKAGMAGLFGENRWEIPESTFWKVEGNNSPLTTEASSSAEDTEDRPRARRQKVE
jgi:hypothetical protein